MTNLPQTCYLIYADDAGVDCLARITIEAQVPLTWQYEADAPAIPGEPGTLEDMAAQGYVAVRDLCDPLCAIDMDDIIARYWITHAEAAHVFQAPPLPPPEDPAHGQ